MVIWGLIQEPPQGDGIQGGDRYARAFLANLREVERGSARRDIDSRMSSWNSEHLECSHQPHIQGRGAKKRTQRAG